MNTSSFAGLPQGSMDCKTQCREARLRSVPKQWTQPQTTNRVSKLALSLSSAGILSSSRRSGMRRKGGRRAWRRHSKCCATCRSCMCGDRIDQDSEIRRRHRKAAAWGVRRLNQMPVSVRSAGYLGNRIDTREHKPSALLFLWIAQSRTPIEPAWDRSPIIRKIFQATMAVGMWSDNQAVSWRCGVWTLVKLSLRSVPSTWQNGRTKWCRIDWRRKDLFSVYVRSLQWG